MGGEESVSLRLEGQVIQVGDQSYQIIRPSPIYHRPPVEIRRNTAKYAQVSIVGALFETLPILP